jgi:methylenetetrahydrofolate--tRNA-(uracil-5-)-methyltransferase
MVSFLEKELGQKFLFFFDAIAPTVITESLDLSKMFWASRYGYGGGDDYLNIPLSKEDYEKFWAELVQAERVEFSDFEPKRLFEGCLPIEELARRGVDALRYGPLKPVGLRDPLGGESPTPWFN